MKPAPAWRNYRAEPHAPGPARGVGSPDGRPVAGLRRTLGLPALLFYGVGVIVGAGVYSILGAATGLAGGLVWVSLLIAGVPALLAALCYAELMSRYPRAGGSYVYVSEAAPRRPAAAFVVGFVFAVSAAATCATVALAFGGYASGLLGVPAWVSALALLAACTAVNIAGIRESSWATIICTTIEVLGLALICGAGVLSGRFGSHALEGDIQGVLSGAALVFFVYTGFEGLGNLAEETRSPERALPRAVLVSLAVTAALYVLVALAAVALLDPAELASSPAPLAAAGAAAHPRLGAAVNWIGLFSTANTALITLVATSRLLYAMAQTGHMPEALSRTLEARGSPWVAALVIGAAAAAMLPLGGVALVGSFSSLTTLIVFAAVGVALWIIRRRERNATHAHPPTGHFRVPGSVRGVPIVSVLLLLTVVALALRFDWKVHALAGGTVLAAAAVLAIRKPAQRRSA